MELPKKIDPCPIVEAVVEIRFESNFPKEAVFGILYNVIKTKFQAVEELPILQLPGNILANDPKLTFKPHYRLKKDNFILQIGPRVVSLSSVSPYSGWKVYYEELKDFIDKINSSEVISNVFRLGIRYINFFEDINIFESLELKIFKEGNPILNDKMFFNTIHEEDKYSCDLKIQSADSVVIGGGNPQKGSIIDIDIFMDKVEIPVLNSEESLISEGHNIEKRIFFELLSPSFLETLNPQY